MDWVWKSNSRVDVDNWQMAKKQILASEGLAAVENRDLPMATRYLLQQLERLAPGGTVELRVSPYGAIQCIEGMDHRRGTPPNVVEIDPELFLKLCLGELSFDAAVSLGQVSLSGAHAHEVAKLFPLAL